MKILFEYCNSSILFQKWERECFPVVRRFHESNCYRYENVKLFSFMAMKFLPVQYMLAFFQYCLEWKTCGTSCIPQSFICWCWYEVLQYSKECWTILDKCKHGKLYTWDAWFNLTLKSFFINFSLIDTFRFYQWNNEQEDTYEKNIKSESSLRRTLGEQVRPLRSACLLEIWR